MAVEKPAPDARTPCIIGVAQAIHRPADGLAPEPLVQWEDVVRRAAVDAAAEGDVLGAVRSLDVVYCQSWPYDDPCGRLATALGIDPPRRAYSGIGGTTPQVLVDGVGAAIARGELDVAVVCGAEALDTVRRLKKAGERPPWSHRDPEKKPFPFEAPFHPAEVAHEVFQAYTTFALWDVARRAARGIPVDEHRRSLGELFAPMTSVAAENPYAWFPTERSASELATPTADNRMVAFPYTKMLMSVMDVDIAAALVIASHGAADALGVPAERRVYLRGWCYATDPVYVAEHDPLDASAAMAAAYGEALRCAGLGIDDVAHLDLYSCFPSSVRLALDALGLARPDSRGTTVTGGLPYAGGAGSDYLTHSIATMVEVLRADPGSAGFVTGVGMHLTKHVAGLYSTTPPPSGLVEPPDEAGVQAALDARPKRRIRDRHEGEATVAMYTVHHGRDGEPTDALLVCDLPGAPDERCYAKVVDLDLCRALEADEWVGRRVDLVADGDRNVARA